MVKLRFVALAALIAGLCAGLLFLVEHKIPAYNRIIICWAALAMTLKLLNYIKTSTKGKEKQFRLLQSSSSFISVFGGVGMVHFLKGDDIGATIFIVFPLLCLAFAYFFGRFFSSPESDAELRGITKF